MWKVVSLNAVVDAELESLPNDLLARLRRVGELIQAHGLERVREPHVKHVEGPIWEIRLTGRDGIARALYVTASGKRVVIVRVFVKKHKKHHETKLRWPKEERRRFYERHISRHTA